MKCYQWNLLSNDTYYDNICQWVLVVVRAEIRKVSLKNWNFLEKSVINFNTI